MTARPVRKTGKNADGDITSLCDDSWGSRLKSDAIHDIEHGIHSYYVPWTTGTTAIRVVNDRVVGKYLRTDRDNSDKNNLLELPDC